MEVYTKIIDSSYQGNELKTAVILLKETPLRAWHEVHFSRLGKTFVYHGFCLGSKHYSEQEIIEVMKDFLATEHWTYKACKTYDDFVQLFGGEMSHSLFQSMRASGKLISTFFAPEELMKFEQDE